ncbi:hypothetical protein [Rhodococcus sp. ACPA4]|uniref:hypothetical protein n=1 Tax=Rhodococcus sp. ACPA4 TaxID=2028571 RepID=UPI0015CAD51F|nr:hypothetical protein [Rhodococcus sp. ACPA4]
MSVWFPPLRTRRARFKACDSKSATTRLAFADTDAGTFRRLSTDERSEFAAWTTAD